MDIPVDSVIRDVNTIIKKTKYKERKNEVNELYRVASGIGDRINPESAANIKASKAEEAILGLMMLKEELLKISIELVTADNFVTPLNKRIFEKISTVYKEYGKFDLAFIQGDFSPTPKLCAKRA